ncbi:Pre-rRNA-processing protein TSR2-domain-containing protein [Podospora fimiseda]|uniref:Pre-rRNA-processing protein TSR2-domain-containing protein n=1 Tax=Podospora fimiseda TaxID=252190 RepID=A0AAN6YPL6_9PEZI|nr:Pre-rRNA-processing protein TSR2-domain-containing protein [Podospora fimiseda]
MSSPTPAEIQTTFERGVAISLHLWQALSLAVQNNFGGPDSADKRDWFAGAIVDLFPDVSKLTPAQLNTLVTSHQNDPNSNDEPDQADVETVLLQVMLDEFELAVDDDSAYEVAEQVVSMRNGCLRGKFDQVEKLAKRWEAKQGKNEKIEVVFKKGDDQDDETDWDTDDDEEDEDDVEMGEAPELVNAPRKEKEEPEIDEDGFQKVTRKKR